MLNIRFGEGVESQARLSLARSYCRQGCSEGKLESFYLAWPGLAWGAALEAAIIVPVVTLCYITG